MLDGLCRKTRIVDCQSGPEEIEKLLQVDLWESDHFDKFEWEDAFFEIPDPGMGRLLVALRRSMGQIGRGDHVPVIWRRGSDVQRELGVSADGYWKPLARAIESGLVMKVDQHGMPGRRKILIAKLPAESEFHAVARAKGALERYLTKQPSVPRWVLRALRIELDHRVAAGSAETTQSRCPFEYGGRANESLLCRDSTSGEQSSDLCCAEVPTYREQEFYWDSREEKTDEPMSREKHDAQISLPPSPPPKQEEREEINSTDPAEMPKPHELLRGFLSNLCARCGLTLTQTSLDMIADAYGEAVGDSEELRHSLRAKVVRLADSGFSAAQVAGFLLEDCPVPQPAHRRAPTDSSEVEESSETAAQEVPGVAWSDIEETEDFRPVRERLKEKSSSHNYESWFGTKNFVCVDFGEQTNVVVRDEFLKAWLEDNYLDLLEATIEEVRGEPSDVVIHTPGGYFVDAEPTPKAAYDARM